MKTIRKRNGILKCLIMLLLCIWINDVTVHAEPSDNKKIIKQNDNFTVSAEYGMGGLVYYDMPVMVSVTVTCKENFSGTLQLIPGVDEYAINKPAYGEDISLSSNESKTFQFALASIGNSGKMIIQIVDEKGKVVYQERNEIVLENGGLKVSIGILSDDYSALSYFDGIGLTVDQEQAVTSIFELSKKDFPEDALGLNMLQYMVIDNFDTSTLSEEQYTALKTWVMDGGVLILGLGNHYQNVLNCFQDDFITGTLGKITKSTVTWKELEDVSGGPLDYKKETAEPENDEIQNESIEIEDGQESSSDNRQESIGIEKAIHMDLDCVEFEMEDGEPFSEYTTEASAYYKEIGLGRVVVLGYSMSMEPMTSSSYKQAIVKFLIQNAGIPETNERFYGNSMKWDVMYRGTETARLADSSSKPSVLLYGVILLVYVILVGPILYVILKLRNKREKIWIAIPIISLGFTGIIYCTGFIYRVNKPLVSTFTVVQLEDKLKKEKIYTNIRCPKPKEYSIQFEKGYTGFRMNNNEYYGTLVGSTSDENAYSCMIKKNGKGTEVLLKNPEVFKEHNFMIDKNSDNNVGTLDSELKCFTNGFEGSVTNNTCYDLKDVVVTFENYLCMIGDMKKGETRTVDSSKIISMKAHETFEDLYPSKQLYKDKEMYLRYQINGVVENMIDKGGYGKGYIWASVPSYQSEMVDASKVKQAGCGVLMTTYTAEYADVTGDFFPTISTFEVASQGDYNSMDRYMYGAEATITYSFEAVGKIATLEKMEEAEDTYGDYASFADVYAYNVQTGDFEQIFTKGNVLTGNELKKYMLDDVIVLKYMSKDTNKETYIPRISAKGE